MVATFQTMQDHSNCIENVKIYIREHINEPLPRDVLAEVAGFSISHFHRVFTAQTGESRLPRETFDSLRIVTTRDN